MSLPSVRRERCTALVSGLTTPQLTAAQALSELISNTSLRFGGWVGIRENSLGFYRKLYLETPPVLTRLDCPEAQIFCDLTQNLRAAKCLMLGLDPSDHSVEVYFSAAPISVPIFKDLLRQTNLSQFTESAIGVIAQLSGQNARPFLPTDQNGISLSLDKNNNVDALTWYTHADHLLGPPEKARETLMEFGQAHGLNMNRYAEMSRLGRETRWHGVLGVTLKRGSGVFLSITCASHTLGVLQ